MDNLTAAARRPRKTMAPERRLRVRTSNRESGDGVRPCSRAWRGSGCVSISRRARCSMPASYFSLISPPAPTARCQGSLLPSRRSNCATCRWWLGVICGDTVHTRSRILRGPALSGNACTLLNSYAVSYASRQPATRRERRFAAFFSPPHVERSRPCGEQGRRVRPPSAWL